MSMVSSSPLTISRFEQEWTVMRVKNTHAIGLFTDVVVLWQHDCANDVVLAGRFELLDNTRDRQDVTAQGQLASRHHIRPHLRALTTKRRT